MIHSCLQFLLVLRIASHFRSAKGTGWKGEKPSRICKPIFILKSSYFCLVPVFISSVYDSYVTMSSLLSVRTSAMPNVNKILKAH